MFRMCSWPIMPQPTMPYPIVSALTRAPPPLPDPRDVAGRRGVEPCSRIFGALAVASPGDALDEARRRAGPQRKLGRGPVGHGRHRDPVLGAGDVEAERRAVMQVER